MEASSVTDLLFKQLNYRGERQKVISSNIANIDTPDYKTKDLKFQGEMERSKKNSDLQLSVTHSNHMRVGDSKNTQPYKLYEVDGLKEQNDGNNVDLDTQMGEMSKNNMMFQAVQNSIRKDSSWFKIMIDASSKN